MQFIKLLLSLKELKLYGMAGAFEEALNEGVKREYSWDKSSLIVYNISFIFDKNMELFSFN
jgi:hypothetical protein